MSDKPFDARALTAYLGLSTRQAGELLGVPHQQIARWNQGTRLTADQADMYAVRIHAHPAEIWRNWFAEAPDT